MSNSGLLLDRSRDRCSHLIQCADRALDRSDCRDRFLVRTLCGADLLPD